MSWEWYKSSHITLSKKVNVYFQLFLWVPFYLLYLPIIYCSFHTQKKPIEYLITETTAYFKSAVIKACKGMGQTAAVPLIQLYIHKSAVTEAKPITLIKSFQWIYGNASCLLTVTTVTNATLSCAETAWEEAISGGCHMKPRVSYFGDSFVHLHCKSGDYMVPGGMRKMHRYGFN